MASTAFDHVKFEKENAIARFNRFRLIANFWQVIEVFVILALISWSTVRVPAILRVGGEYVVNFSAYLMNHHVVFLIGNVIIVIIFTICSKNDSVDNLSGGDEFYDDYVKHSRIEPTVAAPLPPVKEIEDENVEKQIVVIAEEEIKVITVPKSDDVSEAIEKATRQIRRFQRTQSDKLRREMSMSSRPELRRSETERFDSIASSEPELPEIEKLSNEEFQQTVDEFINKHWSKRRANSV